jgi:hypothetical protein
MKAETKLRWAFPVCLRPSKKPSGPFEKCEPIYDDNGLALVLYFG